MANNVPVTAGSGTTIATDDVAGVHYQYVKIASGTEDATDVIGGEATNGLDVDVTRVIPGTTATALGKAEDAAHSSADVGVAALAVRRDVAAVGSGTDGDYSTLNVDATGRLWAHVETVDAVIPGTGATNLGKAEDAAHTSADVGVMALSVRQNTAAATSGTDADYQPLITDAQGQLWTKSVGLYGKFALNPTVDTAIYAALDIVGGIQTIANWARVSGGGAKLKAISVTTADGEGFTFTMLFFSATPAGGTYADQGAAVFAAADAPLYLGKVVVAAGDYGTFGGDGFATVACDLPLNVDGTSLFALILATATPTFTAATDVDIMLLAEY